jgi:hypothetical protein
LSKAESLLHESFLCLINHSHNSFVYKSSAFLVWLACAIANGFMLVTGFVASAHPLQSQNQRQAFVKHSSDRSCELLSEDHLLKLAAASQIVFIA